jgi:hypothetical protein
LSLLVDLFGDALEWLVTGLFERPSTAPGQLRLLSVLGGAAGGVSAWLFLGSPDPVRTIPWAVGVFALATIFGAMGVLLALLHLAWYRTDPGWAAICLAVNGIALAITWFPQAF